MTLKRGSAKTGNYGKLFRNFANEWLFFSTLEFQKNNFVFFLNAFFYVELVPKFIKNIKNQPFYDKFNFYKWISFEKVWLISNLVKKSEFRKNSFVIFLNQFFYVEFKVKLPSFFKNSYFLGLFIITYFKTDLKSWFS